MRNTVAKRLRREAESHSVGQSKQYTRNFYKGLKKLYKKRLKIHSRPAEISAHTDIWEPTPPATL